MTEADMKSQLQAAQDMLEVLQEQRNVNANQIVQLGGQLKSMQRRNVDLEQRIAELEAKLSDADEPELPNMDMKTPTNGHAEAH